MKRREAGGPSQRQLRVAEEVRHALAAVLQRGEIRDPGLGETPVTVTEVRMSPDLRNASVFVAPLGPADRSAILAALRRARPFLRHRVAESVRLRFAPNLEFHGDDVFDEAERIDRLLRDPAVARDLQRPPDDEDDGSRGA